MYYNIFLTFAYNNLKCEVKMNNNIPFMYPPFNYPILNNINYFLEKIEQLEKKIDSLENRVFKLENSMNIKDKIDKDEPTDMYMI